MRKLRLIRAGLCEHACLGTSLIMVLLSTMFSLLSFNLGLPTIDHQSRRPANALERRLRFLEHWDVHEQVRVFEVLQSAIFSNGPIVPLTNASLTVVSL